MFEELFLQSGLSLERLRTFCLVADCGSFARAAGGNSVRQSQFSHQVAALEEFFGVALFERRGRAVALTPAGIDLQRCAMAVLTNLQDYKAQASTAPLRITIAAGSSVQEFLLRPVLGRLLADDPGLSLDIQNLPSEACLDAVTSYRVDLAIARPPRVSRGLTIHKIVTSPIRAVAAAALLARVSNRAELQELAELPTVLLSGRGLLKSAILDVFARSGLIPHIRVEASSLVELRQFVQAGLGISYLPTYCLPGTDKPDLVSWEVPGMSAIRRELVLFHLKEKAHNPRFRQFVAALTRQLRDGSVR
jgi:DNA-binding transcriptional LysR family regulator